MLPLRNRTDLFVFIERNFLGDILGADLGTGIKIANFVNNINKENLGEEQVKSPTLLKYSLRHSVDRKIQNI